MFRIRHFAPRDSRSRGQHLVNEAVGRAARKVSYQSRSRSVVNVRVFPSFTSESGLTGARSIEFAEPFPSSVRWGSGRRSPVQRYLASPSACGAPTAAPQTRRRRTGCRPSPVGARVGRRLVAHFPHRRTLPRSCGRPGPSVVSSPFVTGGLPSSFPPNGRRGDRRHRSPHHLGQGSSSP